MYVGVQRTHLCRELPATSCPTTWGWRVLPRYLLRSCPVVGRCSAVSLYWCLSLLLLLLSSGLFVPPAVAAEEFVPLSFYPFRRAAGDNVTDNSDDGGSGKIDLLQPFPFFGKHYNRLFVNNNGVITFLKDLKAYRPADFPLEGTPLIAPYWADVDVSIGGQVWYRQTRDPQLLLRATRDVRQYSSAFHRFRASWAFVATWDQVGFYGASDDGKNKKNTFQCVLISNGLQSFAVINYAQIQWTTGSNSHGTPETGLGGNPAQAGFNAGDGVSFHEIEGAGTDSVINLTRTSNVCNPGIWIFRVDLQEIVGDSGSLYLSPSFGNMLGGFEVAVTGPCFHEGLGFGGAPSTTVQGLIVEANVTFPCMDLSGLSNRTVYCLMPAVFRVGRVTVSLLLDGQRWNYTGKFTFVNTGLVTPDIVRHSPGMWRADQGTVTVSWQPDLIPPDLDPIVEVMTYQTIGGVPELRAESTETVGRDVGSSGGSSNSNSNNNNNNSNRGRWRLRLPPLADATLAVIRVKFPHPLINGSYLSLWSDVFPVRWKGNAQSERWCSDWLRQERSRSRLSQQTPCPCTLQQAERDTGRWQKDPLCSVDSPRGYNCIYRGSKAHECIVPNYRGFGTASQKCCYDRAGELLDVQEGGGGSLVERYHFQSQRSSGEEEEEKGVVVPWFSYLSEDVVTFLHCCQYAATDTAAGLCEAYRDVRPPTSCQGYSPPAAAQAAGDPHLVTLDGVGYTFNGEGDFVLLQDTTDTLRVHVRADRAVNVDGQLGNATLFTAVAMGVVNETEVVEVRKDAEETAVVLVNQQEVDITATQTQLRGMTIYRNQTGNDTVEFTVVLVPAGLSVLVSATPDLLNIMVLIGSSQLKGNLTGLLGNYNGEKEDDFTPRDGDPIPITANMSDIHYGFGMTWYLERNQTLLYHPETAFQTSGVPQSNSGGDSHYVPEFLADVQSQNLRNGTLELCQGNLQCMFDFQLTGKESIGQSTKQFNDRFENVKKEIAAVVRCPYVPHIANGNRSVEGYAVGQRVYFTCGSGYRTVNGSSVLRCLQSGDWDGSAPDCAKKMVAPEMTETVLLVISVGSAVGGFIVVILLLLLLRCLLLRWRKYVPKPVTDTGSEMDQGIELPEIFPTSQTPNPVFDNPEFVTRLQKLRSDEGRFQIPRPRYVDPNIYTEYF